MYAGKPPLIAFAGAAGSGKTTCSEYLVQHHGFERVKFAGPLKAMIRSYLDFVGTDPATIERMVEGDLKETDMGVLSGRSSRFAQQTLGTEWGRDIMDTNFWVNAWAERVEMLRGSGVAVVTDDCRFDNEAEMIRQMGGTIIGLEGRGIQVGDHPSERPITPDFTLQNTGTPQDAFQLVRAFMDKPVLRAATPEDIDVMVLPGITKEQLQRKAVSFVNSVENWEFWKQAVRHAGPRAQELHDQMSRTRLAFYIDNFEAGNGYSFAQMDERLAGLIGGEQ